METILHPNVVDAISRGELHRNWRAMRKRIEAAEGEWQLCFVSKPENNGPGVAEAVTERLAAVGLVAQVVALKGMMIHQRPWSGWAVYARVPRSKRTPDGRLI